MIRLSSETYPNQSGMVNALFVARLLFDRRVLRKLAAGKELLSIAIYTPLTYEYRLKDPTLRGWNLNLNGYRKN
jgi:hypothetical protein